MVFSDEYFLAATIVNENAEGVEVLFDVMTHTLDRYVIFASL
jgi:hypothetical protein